MLAGQAQDEVLVQGLGETGVGDGGGEAAGGQQVGGLEGFLQPRAEGQEGDGGSLADDPAFADLQGLGDRVIAVSRVVESAMRRRGIPPAKLVSILNGTIGSARQPLPAPAAMALRHPAVLFVGGLHPRKGVADLLEAFSLARETRPDLNLYLVGDGPHREDYHQMVRPADADNIHFVGSIADPRAYYYGADLFVLSSHADPAPLVISEAREAGLGVIATAVDGVPEMLGHGAAGVLVPPQQPTRLAEALLDAVRTPEALRELRARSQIGIEGMSINRVANETLATYEEVIARRTPR